MAIKHMVIELGAQVARVQCFSGKEKKTGSREKAFMFAMPTGAFLDGQITEPETLGVYLAEQLAKHNIKAKSASFVITSGRIAMREVTIPPVKESRVAAIINTNSADYFPVDLSTYHITHSVLGTTENNLLRVMVYAAPLPLLTGYFQLAEAAKLKIKAIDYAGNAQRQIYKAVNSHSGGNLFVYINHSSSYLTFMNGEQMVLQRILPFGGSEMVSDFLSAAGMASDKYLDAYQMLINPDEAGRVRFSMDDNEIRSSLYRLAGGIARTLDYFTSNFAEIPIDDIILTGPCGGFVNLVDVVTAQTGHETVTMDKFSLAYNADAMPYMNCIAALFSPAYTPIDLIPASIAATSKKAKKASSEQSIQMGVLVFALLIVASASLATMSYFSWAEAFDANLQIKSDINNLLYAEEIYNEYVLYNNGSSSFINLKTSVSSPNDNLVAFLEEFEDKMPSDILAMSIVCTTESIQINGTVPRKEDVARMLVQLRSFESLQDMEISSVVENADTTGSSFAGFAITCLYKVPETEELPLIYPDYDPNAIDGDYYDDVTGQLVEGGM